MYKRRKISLVIVITFSIILIELFILIKMTPSKSAPSYSHTLELGKSKGCKYTNETRSKSFAIFLPKDEIYKIRISNREGVNLRAKVYWGDHREENYYCTTYSFNEYGTYLTDLNGNTELNMGVGASTNWEKDQKNFFFLISGDLNVVINVYSNNADRNSAIDWEDLGGRITVSKAGSHYYEKNYTLITDGWISTLDRSTEGFKYKKVEVFSEGLYNFRLKSTYRDTQIKVFRESEYGPFQESMFSLTESAKNSSTDVKQKYLCPGIYYYKAIGLIDDVCSWNLTVQSVPISTIIPNGTETVKFSKSNTSMGVGTLSAYQGVKVSGLRSGVLYDWVLTCPSGYNTELLLDFAGLSYNKIEAGKEESGSFMLVGNTLPPLSRENGVDVKNPVKLFMGFDYVIDGKREREYEIDDIDYPSCGLIQIGSTFDVIVFIRIFTKAWNWGNVNVNISFSESQTQPKELSPDPRKYVFYHRQKNDDEGIYKLPYNAIGKVCGFLMKGMGDGARANMEFSSVWQSPTDDRGIRMESFGSNLVWTNTTYETNEYDKYWREVAVLSETWIVLQDELNNGYPKYKRTTFNLSYDIFYTASLDEEFDKTYGRDIILLTARLGGSCNLYLQDVSGISSFFTSPYACSTDGTSNTYLSPIGDLLYVYDSVQTDYYIVLTMSTSDNKNNIGTFKVSLSCPAAQVDIVEFSLGIIVSAGSLLGLVFIIYKKSGKGRLKIIRTKKPRK